MVLRIYLQSILKPTPHLHATIGRLGDCGNNKLRGRRDMYVWFYGHNLKVMDVPKAHYFLLLNHFSV